jgi:hypothetical protein
MTSVAKTTPIGCVTTLTTGTEDFENTMLRTPATIPIARANPILGRTARLRRIHPPPRPRRGVCRRRGLERRRRVGHRSVRGHGPLRRWSARLGLRRAAPTTRPWRASRGQDGPVRCRGARLVRRVRARRRGRAARGGSRTRSSGEAPGRVRRRAGLHPRRRSRPLRRVVLVHRCRPSRPRRRHGSTVAGIGSCPPRTGSGSRAAAPRPNCGCARRMVTSRSSIKALRPWAGCASTPTEAEHRVVEKHRLRDPRAA